ncbi:hypothetical protein [[Eubacterium] cellulosolvens]
MKRELNKSLILSLMIILICSTVSNSLIFTEGNAGSATAERAGGGPRPGPFSMLNNSDFSKVSAWEFKNASIAPDNFIIPNYDDTMNPTVGQFLKGDDFATTTGVTVTAYINQTFQKTVATPNYPTAIICELNWCMNWYDSNVDNSDFIDGEIFLQIMNTATPTNVFQWPIAAGVNKFTTPDSRMGIWYPFEANVGGNAGSYSITSTGTYKVSVFLELTVPIGSNVVVFECDLQIDNVTLTIVDSVKPLVVANQDSFGPYNADPGAVMDVDFFDGGKENTSLKEGKYRVNGSSTWNTIFTNNKTYTQNWSISDIWGALGEGVSIIDIYCSDQLGNINDSVQVTVVKDTVAPVSNASELQDYYRVQELNINYTASDQAPSGGYNNEVELWFEFNDGGTYVQYQPPEQPDGVFNQSPIIFNITKTGVGGTGEGKYNFHTIGVDNATNREEAPPVQNPDADTVVDYSFPISKVNVISSPKAVSTFDVGYTAADTGSGIDYVELWYLLSGAWYRWNGTGGEGGKFTSSPISFTASIDGVYGLLTVAFDKSGNIELNGTPNIKPPKLPDREVKVDTKAPSPVFKLPDNDHVRGKVPLLVTSDFDTVFIQFYFWLDLDGDGVADPDDIGSTWEEIYNQTNPDENPNNWSYEWNTGDFVRYPKFSTEEHMVILKAVGFDDTGKDGFGILNNIEVDNVPPEVEILTPQPNTAENGQYMTISYELDNNDGNYTKFWYSEHDEDNWELINTEDYKHPVGEFQGSYKWKIPQKLIDAQETIDIKVEAVDDTGNVGEQETGPVYINRRGPKILEGFPVNLTLKEDFTPLVKTLTDYESHSNPEYFGDQLLWYVTGNSKKIFHITGGNLSDPADTFTYRSILNRYGNEILTFHLVDPLGLEDTIEQVVQVTSVNDPPIVNLPMDTIHVTYGIADTVDFSIYISDVDNKLSELTMVPHDTQYITPSGLNLTFNYPEDMNGLNKLVTVQVSDGVDSTNGNIYVKITGNHRPRWTQPFPANIELKEGEPLENIIKLNDHFTDDDPEDILVYSAKADNVIVEINGEKVTLKAKPNVAGMEKIIFRAKDPQDAWCEGVMYIKLIDIPDKPIIYPIPDMNIHWHNPKSDDGYGYDFSYFVFDPDNDDSELTIWVSPLLAETDENWWEYDSNNNMRVIFKFPFAAAGGTHRLALYAMDPQDLQTYRVFNITVIFEEWPVEQIKQIPEQSFPEDETKDNAFDLWDYFQDVDGGTNFEIMDDPELYVKAEIDENNYVDLSSKKEDWNTGEGYVEVVIIAKDTYPEQWVYVIVKVSVIPVNDPPVLDILPQKNITKGEEGTVDLTKFMDDVDTEISKLKVVTNTIENLDVKVSGSLLIITSDKTGTYSLQVWLVDEDGTTSNVQLLEIKVIPKEKATPDDNSILMYSIIALVLVIILIVIVLIVVFTTYKVKEVFLIHKSGILLYHLSREHKPGRDEEILSGMFTAVQEFIKDSFSTSATAAEGGEHVLREMKIGENNNILIERGKYAYLAVIFSGRGGGKLRTKARGILNSIERKYEQAFRGWVGDMDRIKGVETLLRPLLPTGATPVITSDKQLGRVPAPPTTPMAPAYSATPPAAVAPAPARAAVTPARPAVTPARPVTPAKPTPAHAVAPVRPAAAAAPVRTQVVAKPAVPAQPPTPAAVKPVALAGAGNCPKCGAIPNRFPDGSMLCPKCGYTGR